MPPPRARHPADPPGPHNISFRAYMSCAAANIPLRPRWAVARALLPRQGSLRPCRQVPRIQRIAAHAAEPAPSSSSEPPPPSPPPPPAPSKAASLPPERLKQLRRDGLALKDVIKMGRRGPAEGLASQVRQRWNTSEVGGQRRLCWRAVAQRASCCAASSTSSMPAVLLTETCCLNCAAQWGDSCTRLLPAPLSLPRWPACTATASTLLT